MKKTSLFLSGVAAAAVVAAGCGLVACSGKSGSGATPTKENLVGQTRHYRIPDTRLPFVNGEIAEVTFQGRPHLVSAVWCGAAAGGRLYFWDPETGSCHMRPLPDKVPGAYVIKTGSDGKLYLGCGNGDLYRYDPASDAFEALVTDKMHSITWGGCITDRHVVWAVSPGEAGVYDMRQSKLLKVFSPLDDQTPMAIYGHTVLAAPDGKAIAFMNVPQTRIVVIDPETGTAQSHTPKEMQGASWTTQAAFVDERTIVALVNTQPPVTLVLEYPSLTVKGSVPVPEEPMPTNQRACVIAGKFYACFGKGGSLYRFDAASHTWQRVLENWATDDQGILGVWGGHTIVALKSDGRTLYWDSRTGKKHEGQVEAWGPLEAHALCVAPEAHVIAGAAFINSRFWTIDMATGEGHDRGRAQPGGGQVNHIVWDAGRRKAMLSSYTSAALSEYDPARDGEWPVNPRLVASAKDEGQMRPKALAFDGRYAWMGTSPEYGTLGGALTRIDPTTNEKRVWRNIVPDQTINGIVLDRQRQRLYGSSEIYADMQSCPPKQKTAEVFVFDTGSLQLVKRQAIREGDPSLLVMCLLADGQVLVRGEAKLFGWDPDGGTVRELGATPPGLKQVTRDDKGTLWAVARGGIGRLSIEAGQVRFDVVIAETRPILLLQIVDGMMYYPAGAEVHAVPMASLR